MSKTSQILENMMVKVLVERKKLKQALENNKFLEEDLKKLKTLEEEKNGKNIQSKD